jgi:hypothetical protein
MQPLSLLPTMSIGSCALSDWFSSEPARLRAGDFGAADNFEMF